MNFFRRFFILINKDYQESKPTAAGGDTRATCPQSRTRSNKRSLKFKHKKCEPDKRQLELDLGTSKQGNTGGGI
jgi:hypothetical protein